MLLQKLAGPAGVDLEVPGVQVVGQTVAQIRPQKLQGFPNVDFLRLLLLLAPSSRL